MKIFSAILFAMTAATASANCERIDASENIYELRAYGYEIRCACDQGDELVSGGCYTNYKGNLYTNTPAFQNERWSWHCDSRDPDGWTRQAVHLKLFCRKTQ